MAFQRPEQFVKENNADKRRQQTLSHTQMAAEDAYQEKWGPQLKKEQDQQMNPKHFPKQLIVIENGQEVSIHTAEQIKKDQSRMSGTRDLFDADNSAWGKELEIITWEGTRSHEWLSEAGSISLASEYDDYYNGIDHMLEWNTGQTGEDGEPIILRVGLDMTIQKDPDDLKTKRNKKRFIQPRYFTSDTFDGYREKDGKEYLGLGGTPRIGVSIDTSIITQYCEDVHDQKTEGMENHPMRKALLKGILEGIEWLEGAIAESNPDRMVQFENDYNSLLTYLRREVASF